MLQVQLPFVSVQTQGAFGGGSEAVPRRELHLDRVWTGEGAEADARLQKFWPKSCVLSNCVCHLINVST